MDAANTLKLLGMAAAVAALVAGAARAEVKISNQPTQNMSCSAGVCSATAAKAVLNIGDLTAMLGSGDATVKTGSLAKDIVVKAALSWTSANRLTLDAQQKVEISKPVTVAGAGALTVTTHDGGQNGEFLIDPKQSVQFWNLASSLVIDGNSYTLVGDIKTLASDIAANPSGFYALAKPYDASADGAYSSSPIATTFSGTFEGLGNSFTNLSIQFPASQNGVVIGLFEVIGSSGKVDNARLSRFVLAGTTQAGTYGPIGGLAGDNEGYIAHSSANGSITLPLGCCAATGAVAGINEGVVSESSSQSQTKAIGGQLSAGLIGLNRGQVSSSFAQGSVTVIGDVGPDIGGLIGQNDGQVDNSYTAAALHNKKTASSVGGLIGINGTEGAVAASYAAGEMGRHTPGNAVIGGLIGSDESEAGHLKHTYWDLDLSVRDPSRGAGNIENDPGITGLTTQQLTSGLPSGFSPKIWGEDQHLNGGFPYLLNNKPLR